VAAVIRNSFDNKGSGTQDFSNLSIIIKRNPMFIIRIIEACMTGLKIAARVLLSGDFSTTKINDLFSLSQGKI